MTPSGPGAERRGLRGQVRSARDRFWLVLLLLFPALVFPNLGNIFLWQDEGETAVLAQCVLRHGYPLAHDGTQVITDQADQSDLKNGVWIWTPWLPIYVAAGSLALLGESAWSARLPFTLIAWAAVLLSYLVFLEMTASRRVSRFASLFLATSVPFLLHARQCRYYSLLVLFTLLHVWGYVRILRSARWGRTLVAVSGACLAQTFYPQLFASTAAFLLHATLIARNRAVLQKLLVASAIAAVVSLPFFVYTASWQRDYGGAGHGFDSAGRFMASLRSYVLMTHAYGWPFLLAVPLAWSRLGRGPKARVWASRALVLLPAGGCLFALGTAPGPLSFGVSWFLTAVFGAAGIVALLRAGRRSGIDADWRPLSALLLAVSILFAAAMCPYPFFRYLVGLLPFLALWTAYTAGEVVRWNPIGVTVLGTLLIGTNLISQGPFHLVGRVQVPKEGNVRTWLDQASGYGHRPSNVPSVNVVRFDPMGPPRSISPLFDYLGEITHDYDGPVEAVVRRLWEQGKGGEVLLTTYEHFPLIFYTDLVVLKPDQAYDLQALPDWIFFHTARVPRLPPAIASAFGTSYVSVTTGAKEVNWENIPEPYWHLFRTKRGGRDVALYRKKDGVP